MKYLPIIAVAILITSCLQETIPSNTPPTTMTQVTPEIAVTPTKMQTPRPEVMLPIQTPTTATPEPLKSISPSFDENHPYRFGTADNYIEFDGEKWTSITMSFGSEHIFPKVTEKLPEICTHDASITKLFDGESFEKVAWKLGMLFHAGIPDCGDPNPANFLRIFSEGQFWFWPELDLRDEKMAELIGQVINFKQDTGSIDFKIVDIVLVPEADWFDPDDHFIQCDALPQRNDAEKSVYSECVIRRQERTYDRFFPKTGRQPGVHEMFIVYCSAQQDIKQKYILRIQPLMDLNGQ